MEKFTTAIGLLHAATHYGRQRVSFRQTQMAALGHFNIMDSIVEMQPQQFFKNNFECIFSLR